MVFDCDGVAATRVKQGHRAGRYSHLCSVTSPFAGDTSNMVHGGKYMKVLAPWLFNLRPNGESFTNQMQVYPNKCWHVLDSITNRSPYVSSLNPYSRPKFVIV